MQNTRGGAGLDYCILRLFYGLLNAYLREQRANLHVRIYRVSSFIRISQFLVTICRPISFPVGVARGQWKSTWLKNKMEHCHVCKVSFIFFFQLVQIGRLIGTCKLAFNLFPEALLQIEYKYEFLRRVLIEYLVNWYFFPPQVALFSSHEPSLMVLAPSSLI